MSTCCNTNTSTLERAESANRPAKTVATFAPAVDIVETDAEYRIVADLPGSNASDIAIDIHEGVLTLNAPVRRRGPARERCRVLAGENPIGDFRRSFRIGDTVDTQSVGADYTDGVLTITLPKAQSARPRRVEVRVN